MDCEKFTDDTTGSSNTAISAVQKSMQPGGSGDRTDRTLTCTYSMGGGSNAFYNTGIARAYLNKYGEDDETWNKVIMPYFCAYPADLPPSGAGYNLPPNPDGTQQSGAFKMSSRFVGTGSGGDAEMCRSWVNRNLGDSDVSGMVTTVMTEWCRDHPWMPECTCLTRDNKDGYGDPMFQQLYIGMGKDPVGCWWEPCSESSWNTGNMLVEPENIAPGDCGDTCSNITIVIASDDIDLDDINQNMECNITEDDIPYSDYDDVPDCSTQADPKACTCNSIVFSSADAFIHDSVTDMSPMTSSNNQNLVIAKANQYAKDKCYSNPTFPSDEFDTWLSMPPILDKIPMFNATTGAFEGSYEAGIPTTDQKQKAMAIWTRMNSSTQFPCTQYYPVAIDVAGAVAGTLLNENYLECQHNESARFSIPDAVTDACPYTFEATDVYGVQQPYDVNPNYRDACVAARNGVEYIPADGDQPVIDDNPDDDDDDDDDDNTDDGWFKSQSTGVKVAVVAATSLIGGFLVIAGGMAVYKLYGKQVKTTNAKLT